MVPRCRFDVVRINSRAIPFGVDLNRRGLFGRCGLIMQLRPVKRSEDAAPEDFGELIECWSGCDHLALREGEEVPEGKPRA